MAKKKSVKPTQQVVIYTDGGCWPNPGQGGFGVVIQRDDGNEIELRSWARIT